MDRNGRLAARGQPVEPLLTRWLRHGNVISLRPPPKSTGRELFGEPFFARAMKQMAGLPAADVIATFTELTARSLALNYRLHLGFMPSQIILTGGGAPNPTLVAAINRQFARQPVEIRCCQKFWFGRPRPSSRPPLPCSPLCDSTESPATFRKPPAPVAPACLARSIYRDRLATFRIALGRGNLKLRQYVTT